MVYYPEKTKRKLTLLERVEVLEDIVEGQTLQIRSLQEQLTRFYDALDRKYEEYKKITEDQMRGYY